MYAEEYILRHMEKCEISKDKVKEDTGIDFYKIEEKKLELTAGEFIELCMYLSLSPEDIMNWVLLQH